MSLKAFLHLFSVLFSCPSFFSPVPQAEAVRGAAGFGSSVPRRPGAAGRVAERHRETPELRRAHGNPDCQDHPADHQAQGTNVSHGGCQVGAVVTCSVKT